MLPPSAAAIRMVKDLKDFMRLRQRSSDRPHNPALQRMFLKRMDRLREREYPCRNARGPSALQFTGCNNAQQIRHIGATVLPANRAEGEGRDEQELEEAKVLSKSRCPHTGVVNFFTQPD